MIIRKTNKTSANTVTTKISDSFMNYAGEVLADTTKGLTGKQIIKYCNEYAVKFNVTIPISSPDFGDFGSKVKNKSIALITNLQVFSDNQKFIIVKELCELDHLKHNDEVEKLRKILLSRYSYLATEKISNNQLIKDTTHWLTEHPESLKQYKRALQKYETLDITLDVSRNILDDLRLSFELLLRDLLNNKKSLENQETILFKKLEALEVSVELRNMLEKIVRYYMLYQNENVKHNDSSKEEEIEYVIELTSVVMKFLIKVIKK